MSALVQQIARRIRYPRIDPARQASHCLPGGSGSGRGRSRGTGQTAPADSRVCGCLAADETVLHPAMGFRSSSSPRSAASSARPKSFGASSSPAYPWTRSWQCQHCPVQRTSYWQGCGYRCSGFAATGACVSEHRSVLMAAITGCSLQLSPVLSCGQCGGLHL